MTRTQRPLARRLSDLILLLCLCASGWVSFGAEKVGATRPTTLPSDPDLAGHWQAGRATASAVEDASTARHNGKPAEGKIAVEEVDGRKAFRLGKDNREIEIDGEGLDFTADFTVAVRVKLASEIENSVILAKRSEDGSAGYTIAHGVGGVGGVALIVSPPRTIVPTPCKAVDSWVHVAVSLNQKDLTLYVDGKAIGITEVAAIPGASKTPLVIGALSGGKHAMDGWVDDVRVYHRGLNPSEVEALAAGKEPANPYTKLSAEEEKEVRAALKTLGSDSFEKREQAARKLKDMGRRIFPLLRDSIDNEDLEVSLRIKQLLGELPVQDK